MQHRQNRYRRLKQSGRGGLATLLVLLILIGAAAFALRDRQNIMDWWTLRNYTPTSTVSALATQDTMTPYARKVFYVNDPQISSKTDFRGQCPNNGGETTIVLGCYHGFQNG